MRPHYLLHIVAFLLMAFTVPATAYAQNSVSKVKKQQQIMQQQIKDTSDKIKANTKQVNRQLNQLNLITAEITEQQREINRLNAQVNALDKRIKQLDDSIALLNARLEKMRANYAKAVKRMSRKSSLNQLMFLFSAESFSQAFRRFRYLQEFSSWKSRQSEQIIATQRLMESEKTKQQAAIDEKRAALESIDTNRRQLVDRKKKQADVVAGLKKEGASLNILLKDKERQAKKLDEELNRLIANEERKAEERRRAEEKAAEERRIAEEKAAQEKAAEEERLRQQQLEQAKKQKESKKKQDKKPKNETKQKPQDSKPKAETKPATKPKPPVQQTKKLSETEKEQLLTKSFEQAKGRIMAPVASSYKVVKPFGRHRHPELKHVETFNGGIDIEVAAGTKARAVFDGRVSAVFQTEGFNTVIMLRHGSYLTIYVNILHADVATGQEIKAGDSLGTIFSDPDDDNRTILHFEVRKEKEKLDPQIWIR